MARTATSATLASHVYEQIRHEILNGAFQPGERLKPADLRVRFGVSVSVVREALSRLSEQRLVQANHNQGFRVIELTEKGIRELTDIRIHIESFALQRSIGRADVEWEGRVLAAHHRLAHTPTRSADDPHHSTEEWSRVHRDFHQTLVSACDMPMLLEMCDSLYDASELYRRLSAPLTEGNRDVACEHRELSEAALDRDVDLASRLLAEHFNRTTELLIEAFGRADSAPTVTT